MDYFSEEASWRVGKKPAAKITEDDSYSIITDYLEGGALRNSPVDCFSERARWRVGKKCTIAKEKKYGQ